MQANQLYNFKEQQMKCLRNLAYVALFAALAFITVPAQAVTTHKVCWSHYTGWEPWA